MRDVQWSLPAWNRYANRWAKCQPRIEAILRADESAMEHMRAELAAARSEVQEKTDRIAALELTAASWSSYQPSSSASRPATSQPTGYQPYGSSSSSSLGGSWAWVWDKPPDPFKKSGWLNKMVAMLAAIYNQDSRRIEHLSRV